MADEPEPKTDAEAAAPADAASVSAPVEAAIVQGDPPADVVRPADLPETFWDATAKAPKYGDIAARLTRADELEAAETARVGGVPAEPAAYVFKPSGEPIKLADGTEAAIDPANPLATAVAAVAHKNGIPQGVVSDLARAFIETSMAGDKQVQDAVDAERAKLGDKATERVTAAEAFLKTHGATDEHLAGLRAFPELIPVFEALQTKLTGATVTAPNGGPARKFGEGWFTSMPQPNAA